jgi:hypothetical protein
MLQNGPVGASPDVMRRLLLEQRRRKGQLPVEGLQSVYGGRVGVRRLGLGRQDRHGFGDGRSRQGGLNWASLFQFPDDPSDTPGPNEPDPNTPGPTTVFNNDTDQVDSGASANRGPYGPQTPMHPGITDSGPQGSGPGQMGVQPAPQEEIGFVNPPPPPPTDPSDPRHPDHVMWQQRMAGSGSSGQEELMRNMQVGQPSWGQPDNRLDTFRRLAQLRLQRLGVE